MTETSTDSPTVVIVGGGTAGASVAASLLRRDPSLDIAVVEPAETHYYQPAFTLVGAGDYGLEATARPMGEVLPAGAAWLQDGVASFQPEANQTTLARRKSSNA